MKVGIRLFASVIFAVACAVGVVGAARGGDAAAVRPRAARHLIVCVDGVGFSLIEEMRARGEFVGFRSAARMIAPFPTVTNVAMTEVLRGVGASDPPGYEDSYFDRSANRMRGSLIDRFRGGAFVDDTFRELFDYHPSALKSGLGYAAPPASTYLEALTDIARLRSKFKNSKTAVFFAYTGATDSLAHTGGERLVRRFLRRLNDTLARLRRDAAIRGEDLRVTLFSDHGNHFRRYRRSDLRRVLRRNGFQVGGRLGRERAVVFPRFGLIGAALLFAAESDEARLAQVAAQARGVDFAVYEQDGAAHVVTSDGRATIERRGNDLRYRTHAGDPLDLSKIAARTGDADGFASEQTWFEQTRDDERPDAINRIYRGATGGVSNRAAVIVNFKDGYYDGSRLLDVFTFLQATHGNIGREQSLGFVLDTERELPAYLPAAGVWDALGAPAIDRRRTGVSLRLAP